MSELHLPATIRKVGRYAFYNCRNFRKLSFHSSLASIGAGAFIGCDGLSFLSMHEEEGPSCLREILQDLKHAVHVERYVKAGEGGKEWALACRLLYPEFFEEAVENTPARITFTQTHGMGIQYRNAFRGTKIVFEEYDSLFEAGKHNMDFMTNATIAICRLRYPCELGERARESYREWLLAHLPEAARLLIREGRLGDLRWIAETLPETRAQAEALAQVANEQADAEATSLLLDVARRRFPPERKRFSL